MMTSAVGCLSSWCTSPHPQPFPPQGRKGLGGRCGSIANTDLSSVSQQGYSLLELLLVLVVIGVVTSIATLSMGSFESDPVEKELKKLRFNVELMGNEAIIRSEALSLGVFDKGYVFFRMDEEEGAWQVIEKDRMLKPHTYEENLQHSVFVEGSELLLGTQTGVEPQIFAMPTGEITPFEYHLKMPSDSASQTVKFDALGRVIKDEANDRADE